MIDLSSIFSKYWYVFIILLAIIFYWFFWKNMDNYTKSNIKKIFSGKSLFIILFFSTWIVWFKMGGTSTFKNSNIFMPMLLLFFLGVYYFIGNLQYHSQQIIAPNFHGSYFNPPIEKNGFLIFAIDSFSADGFNWPFAQRVLVVRRETCELFPKGAVTIANISQVSRYALDDDVREEIEKNPFLKGAKQKVFYGWFDDVESLDEEFSKLKKLAEETNDPTNLYNMLKKELGVSNPKIATLYWNYRNLCKAIGKQTENFEATIDTKEKYAEHSKRMKDAYIDKQEPKNMEGHEEI